MAPSPFPACALFKPLLLFSLLPTIATSSAIKFSHLPLFEYETHQLTDEFLSTLTPDIRALVAFGSASDSLPPKNTSACKVFPGDTNWPSPAVWTALNTTLNGALISTVPAASPCYTNWGNYNADTCAAVTKNFTNPYFHEDDPTSNMWPIYQGKTCLPTAASNTTCSLGGYPTYVVNVSQVSQIQIALNFARNTDIRLVIKNTGHCYLGKSLGAGALSIWTHNLKTISFLPDYRSDSGYTGAVFKVGAGVTVREIYKAAHDNNVTVTGGICESVGFAGGYVTGGGHTPMSTHYGMAADNVEALEVVTADGRFITASNSSNPDLFWALRGGGGSTFGIVTSVVVRAHPRIPVVTSTFQFSTTESGISNDDFWDIMKAWWKMFPVLGDKQTYSYFWIWPTEDAGFRFEMKPFWAPGYTLEKFYELLDPWFSLLKEKKVKFDPNPLYFDAFYPAYHVSWGNETVGRVTKIPGNRIFPRGNWESEEKFEVMFNAIRNTSLNGVVVGGYHQAPMNRLNQDNAVSSAFRHTVSFLIGGPTVSAEAGREEMREAAKVLDRDILGPWRKVAPESEFGGSYLNEANVAEPGWQESFYGVQYPRLLEIKRKWDPKEVFYATTAVGSEGWEVRDGDWGTKTQDGRLCRVGT
ncbi:FAD-binding domain-containing protein [Sporormia fimetaria CBS 119925]|uniref:FAD-binding domain-containing protein n=1 Tax=Sporormia fimetaria CBS 119925 TaxID=1340428 RepID=A0A6A6VQQ4_9PLEO|nr:FAD-binding domain-containing protein [Sporormia fimetaria CBS 119925]